MVEGRAAMASAVQADLVDRLGRARVLVADEARKVCGLEAGATGPLAVVRPASSEHVEHIVKVGRLRHAAVVPRGRFPVSQADEVRDVVVLDVGALQRPPSVDIGRRTVTAGVGVELGHIDRVARQARLCLRAVPGFDDGEKLGVLLARGVPGELGLGEGSLLGDVVSALVVTGGGRVLAVGAGDMLAQAPWLGEGVANPLGQLLGSEGRLAILCEVTLRLHPAPIAAWSSAVLPPTRDALLGAASLVRSLYSARLADTGIVRSTATGQQLDVRLVTFRGEADLPAVTAHARELAGRLGVPLSDPAAEPRRVRLGQQAGEWPLHATTQPALELRLSWPDLPSLYDLTAALYAEAGQTGDRTWVLGGDSVLLRCGFQSTRPELHPLVTRAVLLLDAGAAPLGFGSLLRAAGRDRMPTSAKVLLTALQRAWDPEGVLASRVGVL